MALLILLYQEVLAAITIFRMESKNWHYQRTDNHILQILFQVKERKGVSEDHYNIESDFRMWGNAWKFHLTTSSASLWKAQCSVPFFYATFGAHSRSRRWRGMGEFSRDGEEWRLEKTRSEGRWRTFASLVTQPCTSAHCVHWVCVCVYACVLRF